MSAVQKSEAPLAGGAIAEKYGEEASILIGSDTERKRFTTLAARFALCGHSLIRSADQSGTEAPFFACRWGWIRPLATLDEAELLLAQIGANVDAHRAGRNA